MKTKTSQASKTHHNPNADRAASRTPTEIPSRETRNGAFAIEDRRAESAWQRKVQTLADQSTAVFKAAQLSRVVKKASERTKAFQRAMLPVEKPQDESGFEKTVLAYIDLLEYRKSRQKWKKEDKRDLLFELMKAQAIEKDWQAAFDSLLQLEVLVAEGDKTSDVARGPVALKEKEKQRIRETGKADFDAAHHLLIKLANDEETLRAVFGDNKYDLLHARLNMIAIAVQLLNYTLHDNILTDDDSKAEASGSLAHNVGRGEGSGSKLMLTLAYAKTPEHHRLGTLIHEASHGSVITATADIVYLRSWAGMAVRGKVALMNADSYKKAALLAQGKGEALKPLKGGGEHRGRLEPLLGWTDFRISQARSMASRLRQRAVSRKEESPHLQSFSLVEEREPELYAMSKVLKLPWQEGRDPNSRSRYDKYRNFEIKNIDLDLMDMFVNAFSVALGYLDLIDDLEIVDNPSPSLTYGKRLMVTTGALRKMSNQEMGLYLSAQIAGRLPIPKHWRAAFHTLIEDLSTKRIAEEGEAMAALDATLSGAKQ